MEQNQSKTIQPKAEENEFNSLQSDLELNENQVDSNNYYENYESQNQSGVLENENANENNETDYNNDSKLLQNKSLIIRFRRKDDDYHNFEIFEDN